MVIRVVTYEMLNIPVGEDLYAMKCVPDQYKTQEMDEKTVRKDLQLLQYVTQEMHAAQEKPYALAHVPDQYKTQEMRERAVKKYSQLFGICSWPV